jgi:hypothetical protein
MKDIEAIVKTKQKKKKGVIKNEDEDIYDMCDRVLEEFKYLDE